MSTRLSIRWWFLCKFAIVSLVCLVTVHFGHRYQVRRQAGALLRQADAARDETPPNIEREIDYLRRYLTAQPTAIDERERVARLLAKTARSSKEIAEALLVVEDVLSRDSSRDDLRKLAAETALDPRLMQIAEAKGHLSELMKKRPNDGELESLFAFCLGKEDKYQDSADLYKQAYQHKPDQLNAYDNRAYLLRQKLTNPDEADDVIREMVRLNPDNFLAHELEAKYWEHAGKLALAEAAINRAKLKAPNELSVLIYSAELALISTQQQRRNGLAEEFKTAAKKLKPVIADLERGIQINAKSENLYLLYFVKAQIESAIQNPASAVETINAGLKELPQNKVLLEALVEYQLQNRDINGAKATIELLDRLGGSPDKVAFSKANILILNEDWVRAAEVLDRMRRQTISNPSVARLANLRLGECYEEIGETDRRLESFTRAIPDDSSDPIWVPAMLGLARTYSTMGRLDDALTTYQKVVDTQAVEKVASGVLVQVGRLRIIKALRTANAANVDWKPAEEAVVRAIKNFPNESEALLLKADLHLFRKQPEESKKIINDLFTKNPKEQSIVIAKASLILREESAAAAIAFVENSKQNLGDSVEFRLAQARFMTESKDADANKKQLENLGQSIDKFSLNQRRKLFRGLAELAGQLGETKLAEGYWDRVVEVQPNDLPAHLIRFDRFLKANDEANLKSVLEQIQRIDGENGASTKISRASYLIWNAQQKAQKLVDNTDDLNQAYAALDSLQRDRPNWARLYLAKAFIWDLRNNSDEALANYRQAVDRGIYEPQILRRLVELLAAKGLYAEANDVLSKIPDLSSSGSDALRLAAEVSIETANPKRALEMAAKAVPPDSKNANDWLWLGRVRWQASDRVGAGKAFERAVALDPKSPDGWLLLINYLASTVKPGDNNRIALREKIKAASQAVNPDAKALLVAQCYAMIGDKKPAIEAFQTARSEKPNEVRILFAEADFLTANQEWELAREAWERLIPLANASAEEKDFARRMYAICFAADPDYSRARQAVALLGMEEGGKLKNPVDNESSSQRRTRALALAMQRDRASKLNAISLLEKEGTKLTPADRFMLAKIYNQVGDRKNVRVTMVELLNNTPERNPLYNGFLSYFIEWLLEQRDYIDAASWLAKIEKVLPDAPRTSQLKIRLLAGKKDLAGARTIFAKLAENSDVSPGALSLIAEQAGLLAEAEEQLKKFETQNADNRPDTILARAEFYGRNGRFKEAMDICEKAWETCPPLTVAQVSIFALTSGKSSETKEAIVRVTERFTEISKKQGLPKSAIDSQMAFLKNLSGDYDGAINIFRSQISDTPQPKSVAEKENQALAMNNLAFLLAAYKRNHGEALSLIQQAKAMIGEFPDLIDTEALILIDRGSKQDLENARPILEGLIASNPTGTAYYHLALLERKLKKREEMIFAFREAERLQLKTTDLHPIERADYESMQRELR